MVDRLFRDVRLEGDERVLLLCPTDSSFFGLLEETGHEGPVLVADFDAARLASSYEWSDGLANVLFTTWNLTTVSPPPRGSQPQVILVDVDSAPGKQAGVFLVRAAAGWCSGPAYVRGSRSSGMESIVREAELAGGLTVRDIKWRKGIGLATVAALHPNLTPPRRPVLGRRRVGEHELLLESDAFTFAGGDVDAASALLAQAVELAGDELILDLGCGAGIVGLVLARRAPSALVVMSDANRSSVTVCRRNRLRNNVPNGAVVLTTAVDGLREARFDVVALNPPLHMGRHDDREAGEHLVTEAFTACRAGGRVYVVSGRSIPYRKLMEQFGETKEVASDSRFRVLKTVTA
ncbi:MAG TPA: methyltransferase [Dehalococcoidia bacterium]|nr:methyltransferase [Dehalococcoidia bacterium]